MGEYGNGFSKMQRHFFEAMSYTMGNSQVANSSNMDMYFTVLYLSYIPMRFAINTLYPGNVKYTTTFDTRTIKDNTIALKNENNTLFN